MLAKILKQIKEVTDTLEKYKEELENQVEAGKTQAIDWAKEKAAEIAKEKGLNAAKDAVSKVGKKAMDAASNLVKGAKIW